MIAIGGGVQAYMAVDVDGGEIGPYEEIVVVEQIAERTVKVARLYPEVRAALQGGEQS